MIPEPYLNDRGKEIFYNLVEHTEAQGLTEADSYGLSICAQLLLRIEVCSEHINTNGSTVIAKTGWEQVSAQATELNKNQSLVRVYLQKYGLSPEDRAKLTASTKKAGLLDGLK
jgi:hypothetical protein